MAADAPTKKADLAVGEIFDVESGGIARDADDFTSRDHFRVSMVDIEILLQIITQPAELSPDAGRRVPCRVFPAAMIRRP